MKANNGKAIGNWLSDIKNESLCLPRFQRKQVWKKQKVCQFLETLILNTGSPIGVFLVLSTDPSDPAFPPRTIQGTISHPGSCRSLLLDGQQRLSALWKALNDEDEFRYYIQFNNVKIKGRNEKYKLVKSVDKNIKSEERRNQDPITQYSQGLFPVRLLNPLSDEKEVDEWLQRLELEKQSNYNSLRRLIMRIRKIFSNRQNGGKVIPYFRLPASTDRDSAIDIYRTINTNLITLSDHYLAVAKMEKDTGESLYDMDKRLTTEFPSITDLETDEIGELILKISCVLQDKKPSGRNLQSLDFKRMLRDEKRIFKGVEWTIKILHGLKIWYGSQLPSVVPLRVLPAIHQYFPNSGKRKTDFNQIVTKYLWHAFLTERYDRRANDRLKEDYDDLRSYFEEGTEGIRIFEEWSCPHEYRIRNSGWPESKSIISRGILLVCCRDGAKTLAGSEILTIDNYKQREKHQIFPKSKLHRIDNISGNNALNCLLVPKEDNIKYGNDLPGDYITKLFDDLRKPLPKKGVVERLGTHMISKKSAQKLFTITQSGIDSGQINLESAYTIFINDRTREVMVEIEKLLDKD